MKTETILVLGVLVIGGVAAAAFLPKLIGSGSGGSSSTKKGAGTSFGLSFGLEKFGK